MKKEKPHTFSSHCLLEVLQATWFVVFCDHKSYNEMQEDMFLSFCSNLTQKYISEHLPTMLEWTVACSMYLAMPVTKAFLSSKLVLKFGCRESKMQNLILGKEKNFIYIANINMLWVCFCIFF